MNIALRTYRCCAFLKRPMRCKLASFCYFHTSSLNNFLDVRDKGHEEKEKQLVVHQGEYFDEAAKKARDKHTFQEAVSKYIDRNSIHRRGHVEFIYAAISRMKEFNVARDIDAYKSVLELFPKDKMIAVNIWQVEFMHFPKQQQCCIDVLDFMESNGVIPDDDMGYQLLRIFGKRSHAFRKYQRMMYWMPKFRYANPYYVPYNLPNDRIELAKMALERMSVDLQNTVTVHMTEDLPSATDHTFVVSAQSPVQQELLANHPIDKPVFVEGVYTTWLRCESLKYFVLRSDSTERFQRFAATRDAEAEKENMFNWKMFQDETPNVLVSAPSVHEQDDGTVLAMCITGTASKESLASWVKILEKDNPRLAEIPVVFQLRSPETEIQVLQTDELPRSDVVT